jgi:hypothetical protein
MVLSSNPSTIKKKKKNGAGSPRAGESPTELTLILSLELTQVVDTKLHLKAVLGGPVWAPHHSRIVDQNVHSLLLWKTEVRTMHQANSSPHQPEGWTVSCTFLSTWSLGRWPILENKVFAEII